MAEFWEESFKEKQTMWGFEPTDAAIATTELFQKKNVTNVLIPGFGYGRNAKIFIDNGMLVTGIEISQTAIQLSKDHYGDMVKVYHGPVNDMPYDAELYDGIFCHALIHLLNKNERAKLIKDCYNQLHNEGFMVFTTISSQDSTYGQGEELSKNRFKTPHGVELFFYDSESIADEFGEYDLIETVEIEEPVKNADNKSSQKFWKITCEKNID